ncbi:MAG: aminotransferase class IV [Capnocytophaga sp.]|nr:aminotransferase class IV [Capnocytophaga sp.]
MTINYSGRLYAADEIQFVNRAFAYGDAVFDTVKYTNGKLLFWEEHYLRLMAGMRILRMEIPIPFTLEFFEQQISDTLASNNLQASTARVRTTVFRSSKGLYTPQTNDVEYIIEVSPLQNSFYELPETHYEIELYKDFYVHADLLANVKHTNRIINITGSIFAKENDYHNCLLLNHHKNIAGALNGNLFVVQGDTIKTPLLADGCLNGITRQIILKILKKTPEFTLEETSISPFELQKSDELFITNSITGIQPVSQYRKKTFTHTVAKNLIGKLNAAARFGLTEK